MLDIKYIKIKVNLVYHDFDFGYFRQMPENLLKCCPPFLPLEISPILHNPT